MAQSLSARLPLPSGLTWRLAFKRVSQCQPWLRMALRLIAPRLRLGWPWTLEDAFGLVPGTIIVPHYDSGPARFVALVRATLPPTLTMLGIDEDTALISDAQGWQVAGRSGVELARAGQRQRYLSDERLVLNELP
jgi:hypothetical protein